MRVLALFGFRMVRKGEVEQETSFAYFKLFDCFQPKGTVKEQDQNKILIFRCLLIALIYSLAKVVQFHSVTLLNVRDVTLDDTTMTLAKHCCWRYYIPSISFCLVFSYESSE